MVIFAILHMYSFSYVEYKIEGISTPVSKSLRDGFNPVDMCREVVWAFQDIYLLARGRPLPTREGQLSGTLKRANTRRQMNRLFFKSRKGSSTNSADPSTLSVDVSTLEAGGKSLPITPGSRDTAVQAPLLSHVDGRSNNSHAYPFASPGMGHESYEMSSVSARRSDPHHGYSPNSSLSYPPEQRQQQQHQQIQMQQFQQQQQQQMLQQQQQQQYASRPADYQY
jgi:hypothetical protein